MTSANDPLPGGPVERYGIGQPVRRVEDLRFLTGKGVYLDDISEDGMAHMAIVRSTVAHAAIRSVDTAAAAAAPGVLTALTGNDWEAEGLGDIPTRTPVKQKDGSAPFTPERRGLNAERVKFVGDEIAVIVAETPAQAREAADLVVVDYDPQSAVTDGRTALGQDAPAVWPQFSDNICVDFEGGDVAETDAALKAAAHVVRLDLNNNRVTAAPLETRGAIARHDTQSDSYTLICTTQNVHGNRNQMAKDIFDIEPEKIRLVAHDVGGGFGAKNALYPEYALTLFAAKKAGRPVKWVNDRSESFLSDTHGRDQRSVVELGLDEEGHFLALRVVSQGNTGAYVCSVGPFTPTGGSARTQGGPYRLPAGAFLSKAAFTNSVPTDPYRGAGRPEASYQMERIVDYAANELGIDPLEIRRRNVLHTADLPWKTPYGAELDNSDFSAVLEMAVDLSNYDGFEARRKESAKRGLCRGIGIGLYFECSGGAAQEYASVSFAADGRIALAVGSQSTGMGHETSLTQILADRLGVPFDAISYAQGDTSLTPSGGGHGGSRTMEVGGGAVLAVADKVIDKARRLSAHLLEAAEADIDFADGTFRISGTDRQVTMEEIIRASFDTGRLPGGEAESLDDNTVFDRENITYPNGCHVAEVEVDPETGTIEIVDYTVVDDFGRIINPLTADGQVMGGAAQGLGQAFLEDIVYDEDGQLLSGSFMDYAMPRADDMPDFRLAYFDGAPSDKNPLGVKGSGEAGCCGACPALVNAVVNALKDYGVRHIDMPMTPERIWQAIHKI